MRGGTNRQPMGEARRPRRLAKGSRRGKEAEPARSSSDDPHLPSAPRASRRAHERNAPAAAPARPRRGSPRAARRPARGRHRRRRERDRSAGRPRPAARRSARRPRPARRAADGSGPRERGHGPPNAPPPAGRSAGRRAPAKRRAARSLRLERSLPRRRRARGWRRQEEVRRSAGALAWLGGRTLRRTWLGTVAQSYPNDRIQPNNLPPSPPHAAARRRIPLVPTRSDR